MKRSLPIALMVLFFACGCGRDIKKLMPPPELYASGDLDPFAGKSTDYAVMFATDRNVVDTDKPKKRFGNERGEGLHIGRATVRIGGGTRSWEQVEEESRAGRQLPIDLLKVEDFGMLAGTYWEEGVDRAGEWTDAAYEADRKFYAAVNEELQRTKSNRIVFYCTGFNANFSWPIQMAGQWAHFTARDALWLSFCWASSNSTFAYVKDAGTSGLSIRRARELILGLAQHTNVEKIDIIAYSFGAVIVSDALVEIRLKHQGQSPEQLKSLKIGAVYYVAPDEDLAMFRNMFLDNVEDLWDSVHVYTSESDGAIGMSRSFYSKYPRLGRSITELTPEDLRALAAARKSGFVECGHAQKRAGKGKSGHGYWYGNPWVSSDIALSLRTRRAPDKRGLVRSEGAAIWEFPEDYPARIAKIASDVAAGR